MIKIENVDVWGFEHAIRGMRNPMNSWDKSDSNFDLNGVHFSIGENDLDLMRRLYKAGSEHRKYLRQIFVSMDITAPLYWWKEFDTYKVGTVANSCSTMHKIHTKEFNVDDFSHDHIEDTHNYQLLLDIIDSLNEHRKAFNTENDPIIKKRHWYEMIQMLPSSYNQKRTITMNYENVISMINQRETHKLNEWRNFVGCLRQLPYVDEIIGR